MAAAQAAEMGMAQVGQGGVETISGENAELFRMRGTLLRTLKEPARAPEVKKTRTRGSCWPDPTADEHPEDKPREDKPHESHCVALPCACRSLRTGHRLSSNSRGSRRKTL